MLWYRKSKAQKHHAAGRNTSRNSHPASAKAFDFSRLSTSHAIRIPVRMPLTKPHHRKVRIMPANASWSAKPRLYPTTNCESSQAGKLHIHVPKAKGCSFNHACWKCHHAPFHHTTCMECGVTRHLLSLAHGILDQRESVHHPTTHSMH